MLNILQKNGLVNVLIVVTRYFGGILLGTGGLVRIYTESVQKVLEKSTYIKKCLGIEMQVVMDYNEYNHFKYYCNSNNVLITDVEYGQMIKCRIELEENKKEQIKVDFETKNIILKEIKEIGKKYITKNI